MISAKIIADSVNIDSGKEKRITTFELTYPRFVHAELLTHRVFSRNSSSSRALPVSKFITEVKENPAMPIFWGKNQKGMQTVEEVSEDTKSEAIKVWLEARDSAIEYALKLEQLGLHKQIVNRILEPFFYIKVLLTATELKNFFKLRAHSAAQQEIQKVAVLMQKALKNSTPKELHIGEWHLPFSQEYISDLPLEQKLKICTARAARVSYMNFDGKIDFDKDYQLHDDLLSEGHFSPFEHSARAEFGVWDNFDQWRSYRNVVTSKVKQKL